MFFAFLSILLPVFSTTVFNLFEVFDTSLTWQYRVAVGKMGLTKRCILKSLENSVNSAFLSDEEKASLKIRINEYVEELKN